MRRSAAVFVLVVALWGDLAEACSWSYTHFHQVTQLRGRVVGTSGRIPFLQSWRWYRQRFVRRDIGVYLYEYRFPIDSMTELKEIARTRTDSEGRFEFKDVTERHYFLVVGDGDERDTFTVEITSKARETDSILVDISPHYPDCSGGHEFLISWKERGSERRKETAKP